MAYKLTCTSHREVQSCLSGSMEACALLYELVVLSNWKEQSSSKHFLTNKEGTQPRQYPVLLLFFLFHAFLAYLYRKTSAFNLDKLSVKVLSFLSVPWRKVQASSSDRKYYLIILNLLIDIVIKWYMCQETKTFSWQGQEMTFSSKNNESIYTMSFKM